MITISRFRLLCFYCFPNNLPALAILGMISSSSPDIQAIRALKEKKKKKVKMKSKKERERERKRERERERERESERE